MLRTYLAFWREHRDVVFADDLMPMEPQNSFPAVLARTEKKLLIGVFANTVIHLPESLPGQILIVNATCMKQVVLHSETDLGTWHMKVSACTGEAVRKTGIEIAAGVTPIEVPPSAYISLAHKLNQ